MQALWSALWHLEPGNGVTFLSGASALTVAMGNNKLGEQTLHFVSAGRLPTCICGCCTFCEVFWLPLELPKISWIMRGSMLTVSMTTLRLQLNSFICFREAYKGIVESGLNFVDTAGEARLLLTRKE